MLEDMSYTIRAAVDADVPAIADIYNEAVIRGGASADLEPVSLESRRAWVTPISTCQVSGRRHQRSRSAVVGFGSLSKFHQRAGYDGIAELSYYIAGDHQRQGLGTMMVRWLIDAAAERGFTHVTAIIYADNAGSVALMRRFGFIRFGLLPAAVGALDGKLHDMSYWVKALAGGVQSLRLKTGE